MVDFDVVKLEDEIVEKVKIVLIGGPGIKIEKFPDDPANYSLLSSAAVLVHYRGDIVSDLYGGQLQEITDIFDLTVISKKLYSQAGKSSDSIHSILKPIRDSVKGFRLSNGSALAYAGCKFVKYINGEWHYLVTFKAKTGLN